MLRSYLPMARTPSQLGRTLVLAGLVAAVALSVSAAEQSPSEAPAGNPFGRDPQAIAAGDALFHERCAVCHGQQAQGGMAVNLTSSRSARRGDASRFFKVIRDGIPGTDMPPNADFSSEQIWQIVSYLRALALPGQQAPLEGDPDKGRAIFHQAGCIGCHVVEGAGGFLGPPLDSISTRKTSEEIRIDVLEPSSNLAEGFKTVVAETLSGARIEGILKNENPFTVLVLVDTGAVRSLKRDQLRAVAKPNRSRMPADFGTRLSPDSLKNLLAFLDRQRNPYVPVVRGFHGY